MRMVPYSPLSTLSSCTLKFSSSHSTCFCCVVPLVLAAAVAEDAGLLLLLLVLSAEPRRERPFEDDMADERSVSLSLSLSLSLSFLLLLFRFLIEKKRERRRKREREEEREREKRREEKRESGGRQRERRRRTARHGTMLLQHLWRGSRACQLQTARAYAAAKKGPKGGSGSGALKGVKPDLAPWMPLILKPEALDNSSKVKKKEDSSQKFTQEELADAERRAKEFSRKKSMQDLEYRRDMAEKFRLKNQAVEALGKYSPVLKKVASLPDLEPFPLTRRIPTDYPPVDL